MQVRTLMSVALKLANNIVLSCDLSESENTVVSGQSGVLVQAYVLVALPVKFLFTLNKLLDFSLRLSYLFKIGFYSFPEKLEFRLQ
jgi:hypothetical protein